MTLKNYLDQSQENRRRFIIIIVFIAIAFFATIIGLSLYLMLRPIEGELRIDNLPELISDMPDDTKHAIYAALYNNANSYSENVPHSGALIRKETLDHSSGDPASHGSFIVDISSLEQSFEVQYEWSTKKDDPDISSTPIVIDCVSDPELIIYKNFQCKSSRTYDPDSNLTEYGFLYSYLPYRDKISTGDEFSVFFRTYISTLNYIEINIDSCGDKEKLAEALAKTKEYIQSFNIDAEKLRYEQRDLCDGGTM